MEDLVKTRNEDKDSNKPLANVEGFIWNNLIDIHIFSSIFIPK